MAKRFSRAMFACLGVGWVSVVAADPICIDGICFVDRGASGEVVLGYHSEGVAVLDYDNDGYPDLLVGGPRQLFHNEPDPARPGQRTFVDTTVGSGLDDADATARQMFGIVAADYDNDGDSDLLMTGQDNTTTYGLLYRNDGGGRFSNVSVAAGVRGSGNFANSVSWSDFDLDGWVDLMFTSADTSARHLTLLRNNADGAFTDVSDLTPEFASVGLAYSHTWMDYNADGYPDCIIPFTRRPVLLENVDDGQGGRRFIDVAPAVGFTHLGPAPMGISTGDYDGDGDFDFAVSDAADGTYYENLGGGAVVESFPFGTIFAWGITWADVDNDGDLDNYQAGSWPAPNFDRLIRNLGNGQFDNISPALNALLLSSQQMVQIDVNNDGQQDLITLNPGTAGQTVSIYENISTTGNHWLTLRLRGDGRVINRDAIGAVVRVTAGGLTQIRQVTSGSSTTATEDLRLHFGLGATTQVDEIEVLWPAVGTLESRTDIYPGPFDVDRMLTLAPLPAACCVCADRACVEATPDECQASGGNWIFGADCGDVDCANSSPEIANPPRAGPTGFTTNRYLGVVPRNPGRTTALRVTLTSLQVPDPPNRSGQPAPDFSAFEGQTRWIGPPQLFLNAANPPTFFTVAPLVCEPHEMDWGSVGLVYVYGSEIVPSSVYDIQAVDVTCGGSIADESAYSVPLIVTTTRWGDVVSLFSPPSTSTQPDFSDIAALVNVFRGLPGAPDKPSVQLQPNTPDPSVKISFLDIAACVNAFRGGAYPYTGPAPCE